MKTAILILGFLLLPSIYAFSQDDSKDTGKNKTVYLVISKVECHDCQGLGYLNTAMYNFSRDDNATGRSEKGAGTVSVKIGRVVCPYCGGTGKLEIREYKSKL
ncbi:MAG: hypothetical protein PHN88_07260 [Ignavibacteria bacterium]|nr:hypothetical protein [Ignavibacteria bacterium]